VNLNGTRHYYKEIFNPEVPAFLKPIMPVIEVFSAFMKPVSLTIRLFANMLAGHIMILSMVCIIFIMAKYGAVLFGSMTVVSVVFGVFMDLLECLVAFIQAYVFTMLSSIYIGLARQKEE
jgi:F-type H+-transporting ATPase subunit a